MASKLRTIHPDFDLSSKGSIKGRLSSITAAFYQTITQVILPTYEEVTLSLEILGMSEGNCFCAYCGDTRTEWDHLRPTVVNRRPTGYITEIANLVPACGKCNQSKGNKNWKTWMLSSAIRSPMSRQIPNTDVRIERLEKYEQSLIPTQFDYEQIFGKERWGAFLDHLDRCAEAMVSAQIYANELTQELLSYAKTPESKSVFNAEIEY